MTATTSACPLDCPDACSLEVTVRDGRVTALDGDRRNPLTAGFICGKVRRFTEHMYGVDRLLHPAVREGAKGEGRFRRVGWDEALDRIATELARVRSQHGGEAILPLGYAGSNGVLTQDSIDARLFHRLGASRLARTVCAAPTGAAAMGLYGKMAGVALEDYEQAALIVCWGVNPSASGIHLVPRIQRACDRGARLVVVDPLRTPLAKQADLHLAPRPGTDLPIALAVAAWLEAHGHVDHAFLRAHARGYDELLARARPWTLARAAAVADVPASAIEQLAELYAASAPAVIRCGWGSERNRNGGSATAAILALPALAGKFGVRGGGYTMSNSRVLALDPSRAAAEPEPDTRVVNMNQAGRALAADATPAVHAVFVYNGNPLATLPNAELVRRGLLREDLFTVVFDQVMTDTARYADVLLPATTFLEHDELRTSYGAQVIQRSRPVVTPVGEARSNIDVFAALCRRLDLARAGDPETPDALVAAVLAGTADGDRIAAALATADVAFATVERPIQFVDEFPRTPDRKVDLCPDALDREAPGGLYHYRELAGAFPLALVSPASRRTISSTFGQLDRRPARLTMHPDDAAARGLTDGATVRVWNELGEVHVELAIDPLVRLGVVMLPKGLWARSTKNGATANSLCPDALTDLGGGATFNDARVEVAAL